MNPIGHFRTITNHRHAVIKHCFKAGIGFQGLFHDLSKYSPTEFIPGAKYYVGVRSPNEIERELHGYSTAWLHHKGRNKHHFEYWYDYNPKEKMVMPLKMPPEYVAEMFCDRVAASKIYRKELYDNSYPLEYFLRGKDRRNINPETSEELEKMLRILSEKGEDAAFKYIREYIKREKDKH